MVRTQIQLSEQQARGLREMAAKQGVSVAELIRQSVERLLREHEQRRAEKWQRILALSGAFNSGRSDISANHDKYLEEDFLS